MGESRTSREKRLAAALRANLQRRKQEARQRGRAESDDPRDSAETGGEADDPSTRGGKT
ncbi:MAG: hypothetical protein ACOC71_04120 [Hyphomicrobiales bacterium]